MDATRRAFLQKGAASLTGLTALSMTGCACKQLHTAKAGYDCCTTPELEPESLTLGEGSLTIDLAKAPSLGSVGGSIHVVNAEKDIQIVVVRADENEYYALRRFCTHGSQVVSYNPNRGILQCNGYNHSIFDLNGDVVKGPAPTSLQSYPVTLRDGTLEISLA